MGTLSNALMNTNINFLGTYENPTTPLWARALSGATPGPNVQVSSLTVNPTGAVILPATGTQTTMQQASVVLERTSDATPNTASQLLMANNFRRGGGQWENPSIVNNTETYYDNLALGQLIVYGSNIATADTQGQVGIIKQYQNTSALSIDSRAVYTSSMIVESFSTFNGDIGNDLTVGQLIYSPNINTSSLSVSSINGLPYTPGGGGGAGPNLLLSTLNMNANGSITLNATGTSTVRVTGSVFFRRTPDLLQTFAPGFKMSRNILGGGREAQNISVVFPDATVGQIKYDPLALGNLIVYGTSRGTNSTDGPVGIFQEYSSTMKDIELVTNAFHTSTIIASSMQITTANISTLYVSTIVDYQVSVSSVVTDNISTIAGQFGEATVGAFSTNTASIIKAITSSLSFNASLGGVNLGGVDLGLGGFLGGITGQLVTGATSLTISGVALATGATALATARVQSNIYLPGTSSNAFNVINGQTQLQFSTLGGPVSTFTRFTSSIAGSDPSVDPQPEFIVYSTIPAGTLAIRSLSDPLNPINPSTFTSTLQSFGPWVAVPAVPTFSTVLGNFNVRSTLTAYNGVFQSSIVTPGNIQGGSLVVGTISSSALTASTISTTFLATSTLRSREANIPALTISSINGALYPPPISVSNQFSTLFTSSIVGSTITLAGQGIMQSGSISSLSVSSINGQPYIPGGGGGTTNRFSTLFTSSFVGSTMTLAGQGIMQSGNISSLTVSSINGLPYTPGGGGGTINRFSTLFTSSFVGSTMTLAGQGIISSLTVSSINGLPYTPGGGGTSIYSTLFASSFSASTITVSAQASISSIQMSTITGDTGNIGNVFIGSGNVSSQNFAGNTANIGNVVIGSGNVSGQNFTGSSFFTSSLSASTITVPAQAFISSIQMSTITGNTANIGNVVVRNGDVNGRNFTGSSFVASGNGQFSTVSAFGMTNTIGFSQEMTVSSLNGLKFPSQNASTFLGNYTVTSTFTASTVNVSSMLNVQGNASVVGSIFSASLTTSGNIAASGNIIGIAGSLNSLSVVGGILAGNGVIGGISLGPAGVMNATAISASNISISSINGATYPPIQAQFSTTTGDFTIPSPFNLYANSISTTASIRAGNNIVAGGTVTGNALTAINVNYSGTLTGNNTLFNAGTYNFQGGTLNASTGMTVNLGTTNVFGQLTAGPISTTSMSNSGLIQTNTLTTSGLLTAPSISTNALTVSSIRASTITCPIVSVSSVINVSTINGVVFPPPVTGISTFNQLFTSSIATSTVQALGIISTGSALQANSASIRNGMASGFIVTGDITATTSIIVSGPIIGNSLSTTGSLTAGNAIIDGVTIGPGGGITGSNIFLTGAIVATGGTIGSNVLSNGVLTNQLVQTSSITTSSIAFSTLTGYNVLLTGGILANVGNIGGNFFTSSILTNQSIGTSSITFSTLTGNNISVSSITNISSINNLPYPPNVPSTITVKTINQIDFSPGPGPAQLSTLNICGNVYFSSLQGIEVQGFTTVNGGAEFLGGSFLDFANVSSMVAGRIQANFAQVSSLSVSPGTLVAPNFVTNVITATTVNAVNVSTTNITNFNLQSRAINAGITQQKNTLGDVRNNSPQDIYGGNTGYTGVAQEVFGQYRTGEYYWPYPYQITNGFNYIIPGLYYSTYLPQQQIRVFANSRTTVNGDVPGVSAIYGCWDVFCYIFNFGTYPPPVGGVGQYTNVTINKLFGNMDLFGIIDGTNPQPGNAYKFYIVQNAVGGPNYPSDLRISWSIMSIPRPGF